MASPSDGSSAVGSPMASARSFNLSHATEVLHLLRAVHRSTLLPEVKNRIRDAVFQHQQSGESFPDQVMSDLASLGITTTTTPSEEKTESADTAPAPVATTGDAQAAPAPPPPAPSPIVSARFRRPAPQFASASAPSSAPGSKPPTSPAEAVTETDTESTNSPKPATPTLETVEEASANESSTPQAAPPAPTPDASSSDNSGTDDDRASTTSAPEAVKTPAAPVSEAEAQTRIGEIKRAVNELVGNPVNLIDANNAVGREYMNALLDAMKRVNTGASAAETERAMMRLETAFTAVKEVVKHGGAAAVSQAPEASASTATPTPAPATTPTNTTATTTPPASPASNMAATTTPLADVPAATDATDTPSPATNSVPITVVPDVPDAPAPPPTVSEPPATPPPMPPVPTPANPASASDAAPVPTPDSEPEAPTPTAPPAPIPSDGALRPVSKDKQIKDLMADQDAKFAAVQAEKMAEKAKDPLYAEDVSAGLRQLLSEWKLFKSSGLFGTGPSGTEHPLYKEISQLTMAAVLAGRYESASAEVKQSITDYMNGWRYEEGIVHEHGETFEHYLRRVIRHILDRTATA